MSKELSAGPFEEFVNYFTNYRARMHQYLRGELEPKEKPGGGLLGPSRAGRTRTCPLRRPGVVINEWLEERGEEETFNYLRQQENGERLVEYFEQARQDLRYLNSNLENLLGDIQGIADDEVKELRRVFDRNVGQLTYVIR